MNVPSVDIEKLTKSVLQVHAAIEPRLLDFHSLLIDPPPQKPVQTVVGLIEKPFGATRIEVVHLIRALLSSNNPKINRKIEEIKTLVVLLVSKISGSVCILFKICHFFLPLGFFLRIFV